MRRLLALLMICLFFSSVIAHVGHGSTEDQNQSVNMEQQDQKQSGFSQIYPGYSSGSIWVLAELLVVFGATALAAKHYFRKSGYRSLKEFIREGIM